MSVLDRLRNADGADFLVTCGTLGCVAGMLSIVYSRHFISGLSLSFACGVLRVMSKKVFSLPNLSSFERYSCIYITSLTPLGVGYHTLLVTSSPAFAIFCTTVVMPMVYNIASKAIDPRHQWGF